DIGDVRSELDQTEETCQLIEEEVNRPNMPQDSDEDVRAVRRREIAKNMTAVAELADHASKIARRLPEVAQIFKSNPTVHLDWGRYPTSVFGSRLRLPLQLQRRSGYR
ncbi:unnamed protein product, partial [Prorocentrum cordatum]